MKTKLIFIIGLALVLALVLTGPARAADKFNLQQYHDLFKIVFFVLSGILVLLIIWELLYLKGAGKAPREDLKISVVSEDEESTAGEDDPIKALLRAQAASSAIGKSEEEEDLPSFLKISKEPSSDELMGASSAPSPSPVSQGTAAPEAESDPFKMLLMKSAQKEESESAPPPPPPPARKREKIEVEPPPPPPKTGQPHIKRTEDDPFKALLKSSVTKEEKPAEVEAPPSPEPEREVAQETVKEEPAPVSKPEGVEVSVPKLKVSIPSQTKSAKTKLTLTPPNMTQEKKSDRLALGGSGKIVPSGAGKLFSKISDKDGSEKPKRLVLKPTPPAPDPEQSSQEASEEQPPAVEKKSKRLELDLTSKVVSIKKPELQQSPPKGKRLSLNIPVKPKKIVQSSEEGRPTGLLKDQPAAAVRKDDRAGHPTTALNEPGTPGQSAKGKEGGDVSGSSQG